MTRKVTASVLRSTESPFSRAFVSSQVRLMVLVDVAVATSADGAFKELPPEKRTASPPSFADPHAAVPCSRHVFRIPRLHTARRPPALTQSLITDRHAARHCESVDPALAVNGDKRIAMAATPMR